MTATFPTFDIIGILLLIMLNGVLSMSELAIVSSREARLKAMAKEGSKGAATALELAAQPGRFLSTVQIGITLIGILAGALSGARLGEPASNALLGLGLDNDTAQALGYGGVIVLTTYATLVIGELVPKQLALRTPEPIAAIVARPMYGLSKATAPMVWLLDKTSALFFTVFGIKRESEKVVTAEELHLVVAEAQTSGVLEESEREFISGVVRLADRPVREIMTPRTEIDWIDLAANMEDIRAAVQDSPHSRLPVANGSVDDIIGVVSSRTLLVELLEGRELNLTALAQPAPIIPDLMDAMDALETLRAADVPLALVHDEYGHLDGIVTPGSILTALAGQFAHDDEDPEPLREREDGSWSVSGTAQADRLAEQLGFDLPQDRDYGTAAGFALSVLRRLPTEGERFQHGGWVFEVIDMDGRRIDKLLASRPAKKRRRIRKS